MVDDVKHIAVLSANADWLRLVEAATHHMSQHSLVISVKPSDADIESLIGDADIVLADLDALPLPTLSRRRLHDLLKGRAMLVFYPQGQTLTYERTREAFLSGAQDLVERPRVWEGDSRREVTALSWLCHAISSRKLLA